MSPTSVTERVRSSVSSKVQRGLGLILPSRLKNQEDAAKGESRAKRRRRSGHPEVGSQPVASLLTADEHRSYRRSKNREKLRIWLRRLIVALFVIAFFVSWFLPLQMTARINSVGSAVKKERVDRVASQVVEWSDRSLAARVAHQYVNACFNYDDTKTPSNTVVVAGGVSASGNCGWNGSGQARVADIFDDEAQFSWDKKSLGIFGFAVKIEGSPGYFNYQVAVRVDNGQAKVVGPGVFTTNPRSSILLASCSTDASSAGGADDKSLMATSQSIFDGLTGKLSPDNFRYFEAPGANFAPFEGYLTSARVKTVNVCSQGDTTVLMVLVVVAGPTLKAEFTTNYVLNLRRVSDNLRLANIGSDTTSYNWTR